MFFFCGDAGNRFRACIRGILFPSSIPFVLFRAGCKNGPVPPGPGLVQTALLYQKPCRRGGLSRIPRKISFKSGGTGDYLPRSFRLLKRSAALSSAASTATGRAVGESYERDIRIVIGVDHKRLLLRLIAVLIR